MSDDETVKVCSICRLRVEDCLNHIGIRVGCRELLEVPSDFAPQLIRDKLKAEGRRRGRRADSKSPRPESALPAAVPVEFARRLSDLAAPAGAGEAEGA